MAARRMGAQGLHDAATAAMFVARLGIGFPRPLVLMRTFMFELASASRRRIVLAPCCALRMTEDENSIIATLTWAREAPEISATMLEALTASADIAVPLTCAAAYAEALCAIGRPIIPGGTPPLYSPAARSA